MVRLSALVILRLQIDSPEDSIAPTWRTDSARCFFARSCAGQLGPIDREARIATDSGGKTMISVTEMQETSVLTVKSRILRAENQRMLKRKIVGLLSSCNCGVV